MSYQTVRFEVANKVATITLNRPEAGNALNELMHRELRSIWDRVNDEEDIWAAVITGAGDTFCVGDDIVEIAEKLEADTMPKRWEELIAWQSRYRGQDNASGLPEPSKGRPAKPLIAAINGACKGSALMFVAHADFALAADTATFSLPEVDYGLAPIDQTIALTRTLIRPQMMRMALMGDSEQMSAERARQLGLVLETHPADHLMTRVNEMMTTMNDWSAPMAVRGAKATIWNTINMHWDDAHRWGHMYLHEVRFHTADAKEGPKSFAEKRKPNWQAR